MTRIHDLINQVAAGEAALQKTEFLSPCVRGGQVRAKVGGLVYTFASHPSNFEGWGIFKPQNTKTACLVEAAPFPMVAQYLQLLKPMRVRLVARLRRQTWLVYPANESDALQRFGYVKPFLVHLVTEGAQFEQVIARADGGVWWFEELDRRDDPAHAEKLKEALGQVVLPEKIQIPGLTPEMRTAYALATQREKAFHPQRQRLRGERKLRQALSLGGGQLQNFRDQGDFWLVEWTTTTGEHHTSAIAKSDLTVISSGICLSGQDRNFDLQSLVGVIERRE